eukprot:TRINITY_DN77423_c0_g1_i1.p1 TRINITY_DN77423_c0_g1~~TRINITY_DN77423_c0_g1_i1.p1  ORF type:complete len:320 (-),score=20.49 TRINITY_DN77423_c0_g1_i1:94-1053(-)
MSEYTALEDALVAFSQNLSDIQQAATEKLAGVRQRRAQLEEKVSNCTQGKKVTLNVGGTVFDTLEETLLAEKETFFWAMLHSGKWQPDAETGQYFVDRSPQMFGVILDYLRDDRVWLQNTFSEEELSLLKTELDFYQISVPELEPLCWDMASSTAQPATAISDDNRRLTVFMQSPNAAERSIDTRPFPVQRNGRVDFTLQVTSVKDCIGKPTFYFGDWGVALVSGKMTETAKKTWTREFPKMEFSGYLSDPTAAISYAYKFSLDTKTGEVTVDWPTGDSKKFTIPGGKVPTVAHLANKSTTSAVFELIQYKPSYISRGE